MKSCSEVPARCPHCPRSSRNFDLNRRPSRDGIARPRKSVVDVFAAVEVLYVFDCLLLSSRQGVVAPATGNLRFWTGLLFLNRASVGSDADGHTTVG